MKRYLLGLFIFLSLPLFSFSVVQLNNPLSLASNIPQLIAVITSFLTKVAYWIAPIAIIVAAYYFLTSGGDPGKVKTARDVLIWTLVGVLIVTAADALMQIIQSAIGFTTPTP